MPHYMSPKTSKLHRRVMQQPPEKVRYIPHGLCHLPHCHFFHYYMTTEFSSFAILALERKSSSAALERFLPLPKIKLQSDIVLYYGQLKFWGRYFSFQVGWPLLYPKIANRLRFSRSKCRVF